MSFHSLYSNAIDISNLASVSTYFNTENVICLIEVDNFAGVLNYLVHCVSPPDFIVSEEIGREILIKMEDINAVKR